MPTASPLSEAYLAAVMSARWFADLPPDVRDDVLSHAHRRNLAVGERLFSRGEVSDGCYCVVSGVLRVSGISSDGQETILDFYGGGSWIGEVSALSHSPRLHTGEASEPTELLHLRQEHLEKLLEIHPALSRALLRLEADRLRLVLTALEQYSVQSIEQRLANRLLLLEASYGIPSQAGVQIKLRLSQDTLAKLIGSTRQRVNQILGKWEARGIVKQHYGQLVLRDRESLERMADL